jgi:protein-tyrosine phosphatase
VEETRAAGGPPSQRDSPPAAAGRAFRLEGAGNARDLGGTPVGGRVVREGVLLRGPSLGRLTDADVAILARVRLAEVIDLRYLDEVEVSPPDRLPAGVPVARIPVYEPGHPVFGFVAAVMFGTVTRADAAAVEGGPAGAMRQVYRWFVAARPARDAFGAAVRRIAGAAGEPVLFHCSAGKDRTGWLAAILLTALGVDRAVIEEDYLRSNADGELAREKVLAALAARRGVDPDLVRPVLLAAPEYLAAAYAEADRLYGSLDGYLRDGLGLDRDLLSRLRENLLT